MHKLTNNSNNIIIIFRIFIEIDPVTPAEGGELVVMTQKFVEAGCKAFGFAEGKSIMLKIQAQKNTERSHTGVAEGHFATVEEVLEWLEKDIKI